MGEVPVHSVHILAVILIFIATIRIIPKIRTIKIGEIGKAILLVTLIYGVSIIGVFEVYQNFTEYLKSMINILLFTMLYFAFKNSVNKKQTLLKILKVWIIVSLLVALYAIYQLFGYFMNFLPLISGTEIIKYGEIPRVSSVFKETVPFVQYLVYPIIFFTVLLTEKQTFPFKTLKRNVLALIILLTSFVLTFSMTALLYLSIFALLLFMSQRTTSKGSLRKFLFIVSIGVTFFVVVIYTDYGQLFQSRISLIKNLADGSTVARIHTASIAWEEFLKHPIFGIGAGNFVSYTAIGLFPGEVHYSIYYCDVLIAQIMAEMGIVGVITIFFFFGTMIKGLRKVISLNNANDLNLHISRGLYFMVLTYIISTLVVSGWLEFWVWFNFSVAGTWVYHESKRLREIEVQHYGVYKAEKSYVRTSLA
jgi:O-antigen ligase